MICDLPAKGEQPNIPALGVGDRNVQVDSGVIQIPL